MEQKPIKIAIILFNLGGPDQSKAIRPFLFNLFNDPAIIRIPQPIRWCLAQLISYRRAPISQEIYEYLGGKSPLLENTRIQGEALDQYLSQLLSSAYEVKSFIAMRYWHPMTEETVAKVQSYKPDQIILLPLYPQFSTTTSGSSLELWWKTVKYTELSSVPTRSFCCWPRLSGFISTIADEIRSVLEQQQIKIYGTPRLLFSAHGLPKKIVSAGDPYQWQVEQTAKAILSNLEQTFLAPLDAVICYQSRVGPLEWIGPDIEAEIKRAGAEKRSLIIVPIAFVSEHSETLVELDIEYRTLAANEGVPHYQRIETVGIAAKFIQGLADLVYEAITHNHTGLQSAEREFICPEDWKGCPLRVLN